MNICTSLVGVFEFDYSIYINRYNNLRLGKKR